MNLSTRTAVRRLPGMVLSSPPMDLIHVLIDLCHALLAVGPALAENPAGWPILVVVAYGIYAVARTAWDVFRAFTTFD